MIHVGGSDTAPAVLNDQAATVHRRAPFAELLATEGPAGLKRLATAFEKVVADSYRTHPMRHITTAEDRRRGMIVIEAFRLMQGDLGWTSDRCISSLRDALAAKLDGKPWGPLKDRTLWVPDSTLVAIDDPADEPAEIEQ